MPAPLPGHADGCTCDECMIAFGCARGEPMPLAPPVDVDPWDHNVECRYCDEQAYHRGDCPWVLSLVAEVVGLRVQVASQELVITNQLRNLGGLRAELTLAQEVAVEQGRLLGEATGFAGKIQYLINLLDERGQLPEHVFTFPDGDTWEAKKP